MKNAEMLDDKEAIRAALVAELTQQGKTQLYYLSLVDDYIRFWKIKEYLIEDIELRGVTTTWNQNAKKNDSVSELTKVNGQMLRILADLGLRASDIKVVAQVEKL